MFCLMPEINAAGPGSRIDGAAMAPGTARAVIVGTLLGFVVVGGFCGGAALLFGAGLPGALTLAAFTGFWGGPGFGGMMGFVLHESRSSEDEAHR